MRPSCCETVQHMLICRASTVARGTTHLWHEQHHEDAVSGVLDSAQVPHHRICPCKGFVMLRCSADVNDEHVQVIVLVSTSWGVKEGTRE